jgi:transposase
MSAGNSSKSRATHTPDRRDEALRLLVDGHTIASAARTVKATENTVREWRDSPEGQKLLAEARAKRAADLANAAARARQILEDNAARAAQTLVDLLYSKAPSVRASAARTLLDRVGVPAVKEVRASVAARGFDLTKLSTDELLELDRITEKARTEGEAE